VLAHQIVQIAQALMWNYHFNSFQFPFEVCAISYIILFEIIRCCLTCICSPRNMANCYIDCYHCRSKPLTTVKAPSDPTPCII
jgi:hypothetical protein